MAAANEKTIKQRWDALSPTAKQYIIFGGLIAVVLLIGFVFSEDTKPRAKRGEKPLELGNVLTSANPKELGITGVTRELEKIKKELAEKDRQPPAAAPVVSANDPLAGMPAFPGTTGAAPAAAPESIENAEMRAEIEALRAQVQQLQSGGADRERPSGRGGRKEEAPQPLVIRTIEDDATEAVEPTPAAQAEKKAVTYVPSGSLLTGVLVYGVDAATGRGAQSNPLPVLVRLKHEAILPSHQRLNVDTCHAMASCYGDLASERAYCRATSFSCVLEDGSVIDQPMEMIAVGSDGKAGLRGRVVSKQGAAIGKAALAGLADGVAKAFSRADNFNYGAGLDAGQAFTSGASGGATGALDRIAQYWLEQADRLSEVIEIDAGRQVTFATVRGSELALADR